jgi:hypothetical protein
VWWFYPSGDSDENDRYVIYNYGENVWYYGDLARTAWNDRSTGQRSYPQAASPDGFIYDHEKGLDDGSTNPASAITSFIQSSDFDTDDGDHFMLIRRIIPDITFDGSTAASPAVDFIMQSRDFSGSDYTESPSGEVVRSVAVPVEQYTNEIFLRARGRQMALKVQSDTTGVRWRLGSPRLDARRDGRR